MALGFMSVSSFWDERGCRGLIDSSMYVISSAYCSFFGAERGCGEGGTFVFSYDS